MLSNHGVLVQYQIMGSTAFGNLSDEKVWRRILERIERLDSFRS